MTSKKDSKSEQTNEELIDDLISSAGGISTFHVIVYLALGTGSNSMRNYINHLLPFLIQQQVYACQFSPDVADFLTDREKTELCSRQNICDQDPRIIDWEIDYTNTLSLANLIQ